MTGTDLLDKALSMAAGARAVRIGGGRAFGDAVLRTVSSAGDVHVGWTVHAYPRDAQQRDLERLGEDMYKAAGAHAETQAPPQG